MTPAPSRIHQKIAMALSIQFGNYLKDKDCEVYAAPFDVRLCSQNEIDEDIKTIVQPDISVICDKNKLDEKGCKGAPDLIIEITSPSSVKLDFITKLNLYEKQGVKEYWIIQPVYKLLNVYRLNENDQYTKSAIYSLDEDTVDVGIFQDLIIDLREVWV